MTTALIVGGPPGAGKSTVSCVLAQREPRAVVVEFDAFMRLIESGYVEPWKPEAREQNATVMAACARAAAEYAPDGYAVVVEGVIGPWFLDAFGGAFAETGAEAIYVVLRPSLDATLFRYRAREARHGLDERAVEQMCEAFSDLGEYERHVVDTTDQTPDETADHIAPLIASGLYRF